MFEVRLHGRPLRRNDAVHARVAQRAIWRALMASQNAVELRAEPFDRAAALMVEEVRPEFDGDAVEALECMPEQHQLALRVDRCALHALAIPGRTDLDAFVAGVDVHVRRHAARLARRVVDHREWQHRAGTLQRETPFDLGTYLLRAWHERVPEVPELPVRYRFGELGLVRAVERNELRMAPAERDRFRPHRRYSPDGAPIIRILRL